MTEPSSILDNSGIDDSLAFMQDFNAESHNTEESSEQPAAAVDSVLKDIHDEAPENKKRKINPEEENEGKDGVAASATAPDASAQQPLNNLNPPPVFGYSNFIHFNNMMQQQLYGLTQHSMQQHGQSNQQPHQAMMYNPLLAQAMQFNMQQVAAGMKYPYEQDSRLTGRPPICLYMSCDNDSLSEYQCLVRKQIQIFEANKEDAETNAQGRNKPIQVGQIGICCRHCSFLSPKHRSRGAIYYPAKLNGLYQAAQNMAAGHFAQHCQHMPPYIREELLRLKERKSSAGGGKKYWADGVRVLGVAETEGGLRFTSSIDGSSF